MEEEGEEGGEGERQIEIEVEEKKLQIRENCIPERRQQRLGESATKM